MQVLTPLKDDVLQWPDGTWCFRFELPHYDHMSDDYTTIPQDSPEWESFLSYQFTTKEKKR